MRFVVVLLAIVAVASAGVWAFGQFGDVFSPTQATARPPVVREPELIAANDTKVAPPAANPAPALQSSKPAAAAPSPPPAAAEKTVQPQSAPAPTPAPSEPPAKPSSPLITSLDDSRAGGGAAATAAPAPGAAATPPPAPSEPLVTPQSVPASPPASPKTAESAAAVAAVAAGVTPSVADQFKARKLTYNRPPEKLALNKPIDISLIISTNLQSNAADTIKDLPGKIVERNVDLSDFVAAELKGADFDIQLQTAAPRQKLSPTIDNEWRWRVTPTAVGTRTLTLTVYGYATGSLDAEPLDSYRDNITVEVQQIDELITWARGVQPLFAVLAALAGATSASFAFLRFREERKKNKAA